MRLAFTILTCLAVLSFTSCQKLQDALTTEITVGPKPVDFSIPVISQTSTSEITLKDVQVTTNLDSLIKVNTPSLSDKKIKSVKMKSYRIELSNSDDANNLANFQSMNVSVAAIGGAPVMFGNVIENPDVKSSSLTVPAIDNVELKDYLLPGTYRYILKGKVRRATKKVIEAKIIAEYTITIGM